MQNILKSTLLVLALGVAGAAFAQTPDAVAPTQAAPAVPQRQPNPSRQAKELSKRLGLSADQTAQLEPILAARDQKVADLNANTSLDPKSMRQQRRAIMVDTDAKLTAILTPEQQKQYAALKAKRRQAVQGASTIMQQGQRI